MVPAGALLVVLDNCEHVLAASLTPAEREVVRLVGEGLRNDAIAGRLFIAPGTVKVHDDLASY